MGLTNKEIEELIFNTELTPEEVVDRLINDRKQDWENRINPPTEAHDHTCQFRKWGLEALPCDCSLEMGRDAI